MGGHRCGCLSAVIAPRLARQEQYGGRHRLSAANETFLTKYGFVSHIHRKKPKGRAMPETMRRANKENRKSARVSSTCLPSKSIEWGYSSEHRGMANRVYNIKRLLFLRNLAIA
jgi:IS5 family transposase